MNPSIEKLQKYFKLEAERGYDNKAVIGGMERMVESWEPAARADGIPEEIIEMISIRLRDYQRLSENSRKETLYGIWTRVKREFDDEDSSAEPDAVPTQAAPQSAPSPEKPVDEIPASKPIPEPPPPTERQPEAGPEPEATPKVDRLPRTQEPTAAMNAAVTVLNDVGPKNAEKLARLDIHNLGDLLYHFPRRYDDYSRMKPINQLQYGEEVTVLGTVQSVANRKVKSGKLNLMEVVLHDGSAAMKISWFNQPWLARQIRRGDQIVVAGKVEQYLGRHTMTNPEWEKLERKNLHTNRIVPIYPLTANISQHWMRQTMDTVVSYWAPRVADPYNDQLLDEAGLQDLPTALMQVHFPTSWENLRAARHRLAFDEIFLLQLGVLQQKRTWQERNAQIFQTADEWIEQRLATLPFELTAAQQRALDDLRQDLAAGRPMNRLLQGDVGSGKTVIAALGIAMVVQAGSQAAMMAPTSILAEQHYRNMLNFLTGLVNGLQPEQIQLMVGATPEAEKEMIRQGLADGSIKVVIGTHALIEDPVAFADMQMVVIDEQHRFGVQQRASLRSKGSNPHLLVMTATPIPRSLALTVYGDLDLSIIDEMPPGRQAIQTHLLIPKERERAYSFIRKQITEGHQAFIIYPLVEESDKSEEKAAVEEHARLQKEIFPDYQLGLMHGRLKPAEKDAVMAAFRDGQYHILVSTSVVEVGVDVPNATVMLIEGANRFGLAQLHQFRGRVGRGPAQAYCLLIPQSPDAVENERLQAMVSTNDGFELAERDLAQRGPGDFLGTRQAGFSELKLASLTDVKLIEKARKQAQELFHRDPELQLPENARLAEAVERFWQPGQGDLS
ncbi:MAG: ATP-dependent DNA helicase RecG [Anaerolineales bacterium]|nr:ATP-dependent DNA helicase RecG [Anaerolineales bacterium]